VSVIWLVALILLGIAAAELYRYPLHRISRSADVSYNEGWNAYRAEKAAYGDPLYGQPPKFTLTNYPPLSFHLIGFLGKFTGGVTVAGRNVSLASLASLAILITVLVRRFTGQWRLGVYAALLFGMGLAVFLPDRIGMNDPQMLGLAWSLAGLYLYARHPDSKWLLIASALSFAISLFTKHNLLAFPCAVGAHLLIRRTWRSFAVWTGTLAAACALFLMLTFVLDGRYFFTHLLAPRAYSFQHGFAINLLPYLMTFQIPLAAAALWSIWNAVSPARGLLVIAFVLAHVLGFGFAGGDGVAGNVMFDALILIAVVTAIGVGDFAVKVKDLRFGSLLLLTGIILPFLGILTVLPIQLNSNLRLWKAQAEGDHEFAQAVAVLGSSPGPALCEDQLLCFDARKPDLFDAFFVNDQIRIGRIHEDDVLREIQSGRFRVIELNIPSGQPLLPAAGERFSAPLMRAILERYSVAMRGAEFVLLVPKDDTGR
jgi:hypothetical protein